MVKSLLVLFVGLTAFAKNSIWIRTYHLSCERNDYGVFAEIHTNSKENPIEMLSISPGQNVNFNLRIVGGDLYGRPNITDSLFIGVPPQSQYVILYGPELQAPKVVRAEINQKTFFSTSSEAGRGRFSISDMNNKTQRCNLSEIKE